MSYVQETDARIVPPPPLPTDYEDETYGVIEFSSSLLADYTDRTYGGRADQRSTGQHLIRPAWEVIQQVEDENIADQASRILLVIEKAISIFQNQAFNPDYLPYLRASRTQDGSILIEWIFDNFRIGFSIEPASDESSWYLVSNSELGEISASGYISQSESKNISLILWILYFVTLHFSNLI